MPKLRGGNVRGSVHGGAHFDDEEEKEAPIAFSLNPDMRNQSEKAPLMDMGASDVSIAHVAGTIEVDEKARLKKLLFRATRGKALTFFQDYELPLQSKDPKEKPKTKSVYIVVF